MILNEGRWVSGELLKVCWVLFASVICLYLNMLFFGVLFVFLNFAVFMLLISLLTSLYVCSILSILSLSSSCICPSLCFVRFHLVGLRLKGILNLDFFL